MDEKEIEIKKLLIQYRDILKRLSELGAIRSVKMIPDYGEFIACQKLNLKLTDSSVNKGYDAIDKEGKKYEIKTRKANMWSKPSVFPVKKEQIKSADYFVYVEFDDDWNLIKLLKIPSFEIKPTKYDRVNVNKELVEKYSVLNSVYKVKHAKMLYDGAVKALNGK